MVILLWHFLYIIIEVTINHDLLIIYNFVTIVCIK